MCKDPCQWKGMCDQLAIEKCGKDTRWRVENNSGLHVTKENSLESSIDGVFEFTTKAILEEVIEATNLDKLDAILNKDCTAYASQN